MAEVKRSCFRRILQREPDAPYIWYDPSVEDSDIVPLDDPGHGSTQPAAGAEVRGTVPYRRSLDGTAGPMSLNQP